jgi:hypothetical protein
VQQALQVIKVPPAYKELWVLQAFKVTKVPLD